MNKLEQLQHNYGLDKVFLVASWVYNSVKFFRYYVQTTNSFELGQSSNLNTSNMECQTVLEGVEKGLLDADFMKAQLLELNRSFLGFVNVTDNWAANFGKYLISNWALFRNFEFNVPIMLKGRTEQVILLGVYKDYSKHKIRVLVKDDMGTWTEFASQVLNLVNDENIIEEFKEWRDYQIENASLRSLCSGVDLRVARFIKSVLCK